MLNRNLILGIGLLSAIIGVVIIENVMTIEAPMRICLELCLGFCLVNALIVSYTTGTASIACMAAGFCYASMFVARFYGFMEGKELCSVQETLLVFLGCDFLFHLIKDNWKGGFPVLLFLALPLFGQAQISKTVNCSAGTLQLRYVDNFAAELIIDRSRLVLVPLDEQLSMIDEQGLVDEYYDRPNNMLYRILYDKNDKKRKLPLSWESIKMKRL